MNNATNFEDPFYFYWNSTPERCYTCLADVFPWQVFDLSCASYQDLRDEGKRLHLCIYDVILRKWREDKRVTIRSCYLCSPIANYMSESNTTDWMTTLKVCKSCNSHVWPCEVIDLWYYSCRDNHTLHRFKVSYKVLTSELHPRKNYWSGTHLNSIPNRDVLLPEISFNQTILRRFHSDSRIDVARCQFCRRPPGRPRKRARTERGSVCCIALLKSSAFAAASPRPVPPSALQLLQSTSVPVPPSVVQETPAEDVEGSFHHSVTE